MQKIISDRGALCNDRPAEGYNNPKSVHTKQKKLEKHEAKPIEWTREIDKFTITAADANIPLSASDGNSRQKFSERTEQHHQPIRRNW